MKSSVMSAELGYMVTVSKSLSDMVGEGQQGSKVSDLDLNVGSTIHNSWAPNQPLSGPYDTRAASEHQCRRGWMLRVLAAPLQYLVLSVLLFKSLYKAPHVDLTYFLNDQF
jgi:hypothetical protein